MSKIEKELSDLLDISPKRGEDRQDFLKRIVVGVNDCDDKTYNKISEDALNWFNDAGDKAEAGKDLPDFPDAEKPKEETRSRRRVEASKDDEAKKEPYEPKKGDTVLVVTKRDKKYTGEVTEVDDEILVVKTEDGEEEAQRSRLASISLVSAGKSSRSSAKDEEPEDPVKVGAEVEVTTKRGKTYTGKIVEIDGDVIVLKTADGEEEFQKDRLETIKAVGKKDEPRSRRGGAKEEDKDDAPKGKRGAGGGTNRLRDVMVEHLGKKGKMMSLDDLAAVAKKEGLEVKDNTMSLVHSAFSNVIELLEKADLLNLK